MKECISFTALERFLQVALLIAFTHEIRSDDGPGSCSRSRSRIAQSIVEKSVLPILEGEGLSVGEECPLRRDRNMYWHNEQHKWSQVSSHWNCLYCGKSFYNEKYIDQHYENRHPETILQDPRAVCLDNHCDYLRCDVIANIRTSSFWDEALCNDKDLGELRRKCMGIMKMCIPHDISEAEKHTILGKLDSSVCSYLTCEQYWENPHKEVPPQRTAAYIIAGIFTVFGFIMYYVMACSHLYSDDYLADSDGLVRNRTKLADMRRYHSQPPSQGQLIRNRQGLLGER